MNELVNKGKVFPYDKDTANIISEIEIYLDLKHKNIYKMDYNQLVEYINEITLILLYKI